MFSFVQPVDDRIGMINPFVKFELVSRQTNIRASALQTFADFCAIYILIPKVDVGNEQDYSEAWRGG